MPFQAYASYVMDPPQVSFSLSNLSLPLIHYVVCWCLLWCFMSTFKFPCCCHVHQWKPNYWGVHCCNSMECAVGWHMCLLVMTCGSHQKCMNGCSFHCFALEGPSCYSFSHSIKMAGHTALGDWHESSGPSAFLIWWGGVFSPRLCSI